MATGDYTELVPSLSWFSHQESEGTSSACAGEKSRIQETWRGDRTVSRGGKERDPCL
jgi:hypothetical protein